MKDDLILENIERYIHLEKEEVNLLYSLLTPRVLKKKSFLLRQGEVCKTENFITKGCLRMYSIDESGFEHIVMLGVEGWWVSDLFSFFTGAASEYYIDALEDTELLQISKPDLERLYEQVPKFERFFRILLQNAFVAQQRRINQNLSFTAEQRYLDFIKTYPQLEQRIPQKQVAAYLGFTPVFLSMLRKKLSQQ
ncbi:Crp/Fnr family transcriptional regulator [Chitinophaga polysaccharea]|nr:Crp/Fnr family transcriptional regulator [Chitinophaga sp. Ak27]NLR62229.1 Crp/Fnr family transcriptional regulator [Chitinophaga polysaccharea]NLU95699.1 Crp/Fnr family transcriptional regulator [Chitinophaga sp. Ak27]